MKNLNKIHFICYVIGSLGIILIISCSSGENKIVQKNREKYDINKSDTIKYNDFWEAILSFDTSYVRKNNVTEDQYHFSDAIKLMLEGRTDNFYDNLKKLIINTNDTMVRDYSYTLLADNLFYDYKWSELLELDKIYNSKQSISEIDSETAKYNHLYSKLSELPQPTFNFFAKPDTIPFFALCHNSPVIQVNINGKIKNFLFDTGCGATTIFSDVASECEVFPVINDKFIVGTGTSINIFAQFSVFNLKIGKLEINNTLAMIGNAEHYSHMHKDLPYKIDGIIGWEIIKNIDVEIDYFHKVLIIKKPLRKHNINRNLFCVNIPIVTGVSLDGFPLFFGFDTGASESELSQGIKKKIKFDKLMHGIATVGSAGGYEEIDVEIVPEFEFILDNNKIKTKEILICKESDNSYINLDGQLGGDIVLNGSIRFDYINGIFEYESYRKEK